jgi:spermidine synthase
MSRHRLEVREVPGGRAFYIDGSLQFDSRDEAVYHEALALPPLALAAARFKRPLSALVLGGGDGLALKRLLDRGVKSAELVDYDPGVLAMARDEFSAFNGGSLDDKRVKVHTGDAVKYLAENSGLFDLALADFTFPEDLAGCSLFTRSFFSSVRARLTSGGLFAMNAVSPDRFPAAFWSIYRTLAAARLYPRPVRLSIPSFTSHGYGDWGMFLASPRPIRDAELEALRFGSAASWLTAETFRDALRLRVSGIEQGLPLSGIIKKPGDLLCLINMQERAFPGGAMADFSDSAAARALLAGIPGAEKLRWPQLSAEWELRLMETLRLMDWELFLAELEKNAALLPGKALEEIRLLRKNLPELLKGAVPDTDRAWQVFALLMTVLVFVNMAYPDNAYAKGYSSGHYGDSGSSVDLDITFFIQTDRSPFHDKVFQGGEVLQTLLVSGRSKPAQIVRYRAPASAAGPAGIKEDRLYFALSDESYVSKAGELFFNIGQSEYLLHAGTDRFRLVDKMLTEPLFEFYPETSAVQAALGGMEQHIKAADKALASYATWLAWARPAAVVSGEVRANSNEAKNIAAIRDSLITASQLLQQGPAPAPGPQIPAEWLRLAPSLYLVDDFEIVLVNKDGIFFSYPYIPARGLRYIALPKSFAMDNFVTAMIRAKDSQTYAGDPKRAIFEALLAAK